ncbi:MAG: hypothetical protein ACFB9M_10700 [Myxococcota bacterium]
MGLATANQPIWLAAIAVSAFWINILLISAEAWLRARWIRRFRFYPPLEGPGRAVARVRVLSGDGPEAQLGQHRVEFRGRQMTGAESRIHWHDRHHTSVVYGGTGSVNEQFVRIEPTERSEVWVGPVVGPLPEAEPRTAVAFETSHRSKGITKVVRTSIGSGEDVWIAGSWRQTPDGWLVEAEADRPLILSRRHPNHWSRRTQRELIGFGLGVVVVAAGIMVLCFWPPVFGPVSSVGGFLGLVYFLTVQSAAAWIRGRVQEPSQADRSYVQRS